jgi:hypothetical protein
LWTAIGPRFAERTGTAFSVDAAMRYLAALPDSTKNMALDYIHHALAEVVTPVRTRVQETFPDQVPFTRELLQAVNDWQRGGSHAQKVRRGQRLKECAAALPSRFRTCEAPCFRQEAHEKDRVWQLLADNRLPETIAAWTIDLRIAKSFKGGVPPPELQGVIFTIVPPPGTVVLNLVALYADPNFRAAVAEHRSNVNGFADGIGHWDTSQCEVVLELGTLERAGVYSYGGFSDNKELLAALYLQRQPTAEDLAEFDALCAKAGVAPGQWWLSPEGTQAVLKRMEPHMTRLKERKAHEQTH